MILSIIARNTSYIAYTYIISMHTQLCIGYIHTNTQTDFIDLFIHYLHN